MPIHFTAPDAGAEAAGLLSSDYVTETHEGELSAFSVRVPPGRLAAIDAMASKAGISRNRMANLLLSAGIRDVLARLPNEVIEDLGEAVAEVL